MALDPVVLVDSDSLTAGDPVSEALHGLAQPVICVNLEDLEGNADDTVTIRFEGEAATYEADTRTLSETGSYTVDLPRADYVEIESANGVTYSAEVRPNGT